MTGMPNFLNLSTTAKRFRFVAILEAFTWLGLLIAMAFKYLPDPQNEGAVRIPGMVHGAVFVLFVVVTLITARQLGWTWKTTLIGLFSSIPPFGSVIFEVWAVRTGRLGELSTSQPNPTKDTDLVGEPLR